MEVVSGRVTGPTCQFSLRECLDRRSRCCFISELSIRPDLNSTLVPAWREAELRSRGIDIHNFTPIPLEQLRISLD